MVNQKGYVLLVFLVVYLAKNGHTSEINPSKRCPEEENPTAMATVDHEPQERLSRWKRAFGGKEPVNMTLVNININGPSGWTPLVCGVFVDNVIHLSGYIALGLGFNFGELKTNPDKIRQRFLNSFFGPTPIGASMMRVVGNTFMPLIMHSGMNLIFSNREFTTLLKGTTLGKFRDVILGEPFIQIRAFRIVNSLYFLTTGWAVYYIVWKWTIKAPIIAGKRKKRETTLKIEDMEKVIESAFKDIVKKIEVNQAKTLSTEENLLSNYYMQNKYSRASNTSAISSRAYGDYQYYVSFGGDQLMNVPSGIDGIFGVSGLMTLVAHIVIAMPSELVGYTTYGFMYNTVFRTEIHDQNHRKFLDTFMGPNAIASALMTILRNNAYVLAARVGMDIYMPSTRLGTFKFFSTLTFDALRKGIFAETFLHVRIFRQFFETATDLISFAVFWAAAKYKKAYIDPPAAPTTTARPETTTTSGNYSYYATNGNNNRLIYGSQLDNDFNLDYTKNENGNYYNNPYVYNDPYSETYIKPSGFQSRYSILEKEIPTLIKNMQSLVGKYNSKDVSSIETGRYQTKPLIKNLY